MLTDAAIKYPDKVAILHKDLKLTYKELYDQVIRFSQGLSSLNLQQHCIGILLPNCPEFVIAFYAASQAGAVVVLMNPLLKEDEISFYCQDSLVETIITDVSHIPLCHQVSLSLGKSLKIIVIDKPSDQNSQTVNFYDLMNKAKEPIKVNNNDFKADFLYQYSSGSTGRPKRVSKTQTNLFWEVKNFSETVSLTFEDNILCLVPLYHAHGLGNCLLATIYNAATLVILEQPAQNGVPVDVPFIFRCLRVLELLKTQKITVLPAVPYIFNALAEVPQTVESDLSRLRLCFSAGNFLSKEIFDKFYYRFGVPIQQLYGCTEAGSISINLDENLHHSYTSVGLPLKNVEVQIIDDAGNVMPKGTIGEIMIKSPALTTGYHNMPEVNRQVFRDGWFLTGDLGKFDSGGRLYITGRKKILIDTGGRKVDPIEVEDVLLSHPKVKEAVVVGTSKEHTGEVVKAVIVPQKSKELTAQDLTRYCQKFLAEFKVPKIIEFRDEIPKSPLGKILRKTLV